MAAKIEKRDAQVNESARPGRRLVGRCGSGAIIIRYSIGRERELIKRVRACRSPITCATIQMHARALQRFRRASRRQFEKRREDKNKNRQRLRGTDNERWGNLAQVRFQVRLQHGGRDSKLNWNANWRQGRLQTKMQDAFRTDKLGRSLRRT